MTTGKIIKRRSLFGKRTYLITFDAGLELAPFNAGDSIAIFPQNDSETIAKLINSLGFSRNWVVQENIPLSSLLLNKNLNKLSLRALERAGATPGKINVFDYLEELKALNLNPEEFAALLDPIRPRLYSIASSYKQNSKFLDLIVTVHTFEHKGQTLLGLTSNFLCNLATHETPIKFEIKKNSKFNLPEDPKKPIIMIGAGAGLAPFRSFMQDRLISKSEGANWLFFGERYSEPSLFADDPWKTLLKQKKLQIITAFSRETSEKIYVQHKIEKESAKIWEWLQKDARIYICGSKEMAFDVEKKLLQIFSEFLPNPKEYLKTLKSEQKLLFDIY